MHHIYIFRVLDTYPAKCHLFLIVFLCSFTTKTQVIVLPKVLNMLFFPTSVSPQLMTQQKIVIVLHSQLPCFSLFISTSLIPTLKMFNVSTFFNLEKTNTQIQYFPLQWYILHYDDAISLIVKINGED